MRHARGLDHLAFVALLATAACGGPEPTPAVARATPEPSITPGTAPETLEILSLISVEHEVDVLAEHAGVLRQVARDQGAVVAKDEVLGVLDDRDVVADLDREHANVQVAENNVKYNEAELRAKQAYLRRNEELRKLGLVSEADYDKARFEAEGAGYDLAAWHATVERTRAEVRKSEVELEKTRLRAPFAGVVARRYVREGQNVAKDEKCFRLSELRPLQVRFLVPETAKQRARIGDDVKVVAVADSARAVRAAIRKVSPVVDPASASVEVTAELTGPDLDGLAPGMAVRVLWPAALRP